MPEAYDITPQRLLTQLNSRLTDDQFADNALSISKIQNLQSQLLSYNGITSIQSYSNILNQNQTIDGNEDSFGTFSVFNQVSRSQILYNVIPSRSGSVKVVINDITGGFLGATVPFTIQIGIWTVRTVNDVDVIEELTSRDYNITQNGSLNISDVIEADYIKDTNVKQIIVRGNTPAPPNQIVNNVAGIELAEVSAVVNNDVLIDYIREETISNDRLSDDVCLLNSLINTFQGQVVVGNQANIIINDGYLNFSVESNVIPSYGFFYSSGSLLFTHGGVKHSLIGMVQNIQALQNANYLTGFTVTNASTGGMPLFQSTTGSALVLKTLSSSSTIRIIELSNEGYSFALNPIGTELITTGVFDPARIPVLAQAKVTNLPQDLAALDTRLDTLESTETNTPSISPFTLHTQNSVEIAPLTATLVDGTVDNLSNLVDRDEETTSDFHFGQTAESRADIDLPRPLQGVGLLKIKFGTTTLAQSIANQTGRVVINLYNLDTDQNVLVHNAVFNGDIGDIEIDLSNHGNVRFSKIELRIQHATPLGQTITDDGIVQVEEVLVELMFEDAMVYILENNGLRGEIIKSGTINKARLPTLSFEDLDGVDATLAANLLLVSESFTAIGTNTTNLTTLTTSLQTTNNLVTSINVRLTNNENTDLAQNTRLDGHDTKIGALESNPNVFAYVKTSNISVTDNFNQANLADRRLSIMGMTNHLDADDFTVSAANRQITCRFTGQVRVTVNVNLKYNGAARWTGSVIMLKNDDNQGPQALISVASRNATLNDPAFVSYSKIIDVAENDTLSVAYSGLSHDLTDTISFYATNNSEIIVERLK